MVFKKLTKQPEQKVQEEVKAEIQDEAEEEFEEQEEETETEEKKVTAEEVLVSHEQRIQQLEAAFFRLKNI